MSRVDDQAARLGFVGQPPPQQLTASAPEAQRAALIYEGVSEEEDERLLRQMCDGEGFLPDVKSFELAFKYGGEVIVKISQAVAQGVVAAVAELTQDTQDCCADIYEKIADEIKSIGRETITTVEALALLLAQGSEEVATTIAILQGEINERLQQAPGTTYPPVPLPFEPIIPPVGPVPLGPYPGPVPPQPSPPRPTVPPGGPEPDERPVYPSPTTVPPALPVGEEISADGAVCGTEPVALSRSVVWPFAGEGPPARRLGPTTPTKRPDGYPASPLIAALSGYDDAIIADFLAAAPVPQGAPCDWPTKDAVATIMAVQEIIRKAV